VVLSGAATADTLRSNLAAAELDPDPGTLAALEGLAEPPDRYWAARGGLAWN
jgi:aryl-alcohol dehydrogenase-like predicted oxidoreductase